MQVEPVPNVLRGFDRKSAVRMNCTLRPARRAGGMKDHQRIFGARPLSRSFISRRADAVVPPTVSIRAPRNVGAGSLENNHVFEAGNLRGGLIRGRFQGRQFPAPITGVRRKQRFGFHIGESRDNCLRAEPGEQRHEHAPDLDDGQHGNDNLRRHGHEHADGIAAAQPERAQRVGDPVDLASKRFVSQRADRSFLAFPANSDVVVSRCAGAFIKAAMDDIHHAADAPLRPGNAT